MLQLLEEQDDEPTCDCGIIFKRLLGRLRRALRPLRATACKEMTPHPLENAHAEHTTKKSATGPHGSVADNL